MLEGDPVVTSYLCYHVYYVLFISVDVARFLH